LGPNFPIPEGLPPLPEQHQNVLEICNRLVEQAEMGEIVSIAYVAETIDEAYEHGFTGASSDRWGRFGYMMYVAMLAVGVQMAHRSDRIIRSSEGEE
jgi:hypothetical protein